LRGKAKLDTMAMDSSPGGADRRLGERRPTMMERPERGRPGVGFTEYVLIIALVAVIVIGALVLLGPSLANLITMLTGKLFG
jgi:Flp pilus assembly pilin Flp